MTTLISLKPDMKFEFWLIHSHKPSFVMMSWATKHSYIAEILMWLLLPMNLVKRMILMHFLSCPINVTQISQQKWMGFSWTACNISNLESWPLLWGATILVPNHICITECTSKLNFIVWIKSNTPTAQDIFNLFGVFVILRNSSLVWTFL